LVLGFLRCPFNRHTPRKRSTRWDGGVYVGRCRHCGSPIRRLTHTRWIRDVRGGDSSKEHR
jgi:hypothetical protein